jgi:hypothetical protein
MALDLWRFLYVENNVCSGQFPVALDPDAMTLPCFNRLGRICAFPRNVEKGWPGAKRLDQGQVSNIVEFCIARPAENAARRQSAAECLRNHVRIGVIFGSEHYVTALASRHVKILKSGRVDRKCGLRFPKILRQGGFIFGEFVVSFTFTHLGVFG